MSMNYSISMPSKVYSGINSVEMIEDVIKNKDLKRAVLLTDQGVFNTGIVEKVLKVLQKVDIEIRLVTDVPPEPEKNQVLTIFNRLSDFEPDSVIAVGGGSVMDTAKLIAIMVKNKSYRSNILDGSLITEDGITTIMIPTSAGTGSEATPNSIVVVPEEALKVGIVTDKFMPDYVILDPQMTKSLPPHITAATGLDAFCHCIECFMSKKANPISDVYALKGIELISKYIRRAYKDGNDMVARESMLLAAFYGGMSIASSSTVAIHALSYPLGGKYRIAHGISNAMLLPYIMEFNMDAIYDRLLLVAERMGISTTGLSKEVVGRKVIDEIHNLVEELNIDTDLTRYGVKKEDINILIDGAAKVTRLLDNNPKEMSRDDMRAIYLQLF